MRSTGGFLGLREASMVCPLEKQMLRLTEGPPSQSLGPPPISPRLFCLQEENAPTVQREGARGGPSRTWRHWVPGTHCSTPPEAARLRTSARPGLMSLEAEARGNVRAVCHQPWGHMSQHADLARLPSFPQRPPDCVCEAGF